MKELVLAGGCFWGVEEFISRLEGVLETEVGYANGNTESPTYEEVCSNTTGFAEAVYVRYNENTLPTEKLLEEYWSIIDPTVLNRQGPDIGNQYRTGIYYLNSEDEAIITKSRDENQKNYDKIIVTEVMPLKNFFKAEEYHQKYLKKNPGGYCHIKLD